MREHPAPEWVWGDFLRRRGTLLLSALWKVRKSTLLGQLITALLKGEHF
jgi:hypothetical protein